MRKLLACVMLTSAPLSVSGLAKPSRMRPANVMLSAPRADIIDEPLVMTYLQNDSISILKRSGVRSQLRIMQKFGRYPGVSQPIMAAHVGRIAWGLTKLGNPRQARRLLIRALKMRPTGWKNWARLIVTQGRIWLGMNQRKTAVSAA